MKTKRKPSLQKIMMIFMSAISVVSLVLITFCVYSLWNNKKQAYETTKYSINNEADKIESTVNILSQNLYNTLINGTDCSSIRDSSDTHENDVSARNLQTTFESYNSTYNSSLNFMFACPYRKIYAHTFDSATDYSTNCSIMEYLEELAEYGASHDSDLTWQTYRIEDKTFLYQFYRYRSSYIACWIEADKLFANLIDYGQDSGASKTKLILINSYGQPVNSEDSSALSKISIDDDENVTGGDRSKDYYYISFNHISSKALLVVTPFVNINTLVKIVFCIIIIIAVAMIFSIFCLNYYRNNIEKPMNEMLNNVNKYSEEVSQMPFGTFSEYEEASKVFNEISTQLNNLKIQYYEEKLSMTKMKLEYYQQQIKPHFFVNCFSIIFGMAQKKDFERIQSFCIYLSNYVRYLFSDTLKTVSLKEELDHISDFLAIQQIRHRSVSDITKNINDDVMSCQIPPLVLQTIIENAIKHSDSENHQLIIDISANREGDYLHITICDNGSGFSDAYLRSFSHVVDDPLNESTHIGISNTYQRLQLMYKDNFSFSISNSPAGGAEVDLKIPYSDTVIIESDAEPENSDKNKSSII
jgi:two-component system sensor histidine kinase YesM